MNIKEAKNSIKQAVEVYLEKDKNGDYIMPVVRQRPIFLVGAPGIGKTAIMEQIAAELDIALISYSMTHHTRQSAIGLPYLKEVEYGGKTYTKSEYTMSEIVASIYDIMEKTGKKEGILFLDEINCVSETLAPAMLQFLQYKRFGNQSIPEGWVIVTAGNPPQYNKSVKEFDVATQDRLKMLDVEASYAVWKEYALNEGIHPAILSFLEMNEQYFYSIKTTVDGKQYITARGWEDLSTELKAYERHGFDVDDMLVMQYITDKECARKFAVYYDLFKKYSSDYSIKDIMTGNIETAQAKKAKFDERLSLISMIMDFLGNESKEVMVHDTALQYVVKKLRLIKQGAGYDGLLQALIDEVENDMDRAKAANSFSSYNKAVSRASIQYFQKYRTALKAEMEDGHPESFKIIKDTFSKDVKALNKAADKMSAALENSFKFITDAWGKEQEMTLFATELTVNKNISNFISRYGCDAYFNNNKDMLIYDADDRLQDEIGRMLSAL